jgi:uncharacterized protein YcbK (DUF882 family)
MGEIVTRDHPDWASGRWPNFRAAEFADRVTGDLRMDPLFLDRLQVLRAAFARPMLITSGYRDPVRNAGIGGGPAHPAGQAVDIGISGADAMALLSMAIAHGFTGIGVQQQGARRFLHLDRFTGSAAPRPALWSY